MIHSRLLTLLWLLPAAPVFAEDLIKSTDNDIIVYGRAIEQIGVASSASEGTVGYKDFEQRPLSRRDLVIEHSDHVTDAVLQ